VARIIQGELSAEKKRFAIIVSRFNELIGSKLLDGALDCLRRHDADEDAIAIYWVPGAYEIPLVAKKAASSGAYDAVICRGAVNTGATTPFDFCRRWKIEGIAAASRIPAFPSSSVS
jgi:6,7-dimethyl-8-ribityllumazine synthase